MDQRTGELEQERLPGPGEALVFSEQNFEGCRQWIIRDIPCLGADFSAASIRIGPQTGVTIFSDENYGGVSQDLTTELAAFTDSRLGKDLKPKSLKVWSTAGRRFTGRWAIEVAEGRYLSVGPDGVLRTSPKVSESESFLVTGAGAAPGMIAFRVSSTAPLENTAPPNPDRRLTNADLQCVALLNEPQAGPGKFSLLSPDNQWISYHPDEDGFLKTNVEEDRAIFRQSIKIAGDESQLGVLRQGEVALYENRAYWGKAWVFRTDCADFRNIDGLDDRISSIQLGPLTGMTIYSEPQYNANNSQAAKQDVTANLPSLGKEQVSSMGLWRIVSPEGAGISYTCNLSQDFRGSGASFKEISAYRTTLRLPPGVTNVDIWTTDAADIEVDTKIHHVSEDEPVSVTVLPTQCMVITTDAAVPPGGAEGKGSLSAVGLKIRTDSMRHHERVVIYPDQSVHERLANLDDENLDGDENVDDEKDTLWNATYVTYEHGKRVEHPVIKERNDPQKRMDVANAQKMIKTVMSTVKYARGASGGLQRAVSPEALQGKAWVLDFLTYRVTADTLWVRKAPDPKSTRIGFLHKNDVVEVLGFNVGAGWTRLRRLSDGLTGWSSSTYLSEIQEKPSQGEQYRVTARALHVRKGPGVEFGSLGHLQQDEVVTAIGINDKGSWRRIVTGKNLTGWASARYLSLVQPSPAAPVPDPVFRSFQESAPLRTPPVLSALAPQMSFREASPEQIQALVARASSSKPNAVRGFLGIDDWFEDRLEDIGDALEKAGSFFVTAFEDSVAFFIDLGEKVIRCIVDTVEKVIAVVEGIIDKIKAAIDEVIKWLRIIFDWEDILDTRDTLRDSILATLDTIGQTLELRAKTPVRNFLKNKRKVLLDAFDQAIAELRGSPASGAASASSSQTEGPEVLPWILSKVIGGGLQVFSLGGSLFDLDDPNDEAQKRFTTYWDGILVEAAGALALSYDDIAGAITGIIEHPDDPRQAVAGILQLFRDQLERLLGKGEEIVLGLFDLVIDLVKGIKEILKADLRIPFLSDLIEWIGKLLGQDWSVTLGFSLLDVATLILAIPVTVVSKIHLGRAPFKTHTADALLEEWSLTAGVAGFLNGMVAIPLDAMPEKPGGSALGPLGSALETMSFLFSFENAIATWGPEVIGPTVKDTSIEPSGEEHDGLWWSLLVYDLFILLADTGSFAYGLAKSGQVERAKRTETPTILLASILGGVHLGLLIAKDVKDNRDAGAIVADSLVTLPEICSALRLFKNPYLSLAFAAVDTVAAGASLYQGLNPPD